MAEQEFGEFTMEVTRKPVAGVTQAEIPAALAKLLEQHVPTVLKSADHELALTAKDEATAKKLALYARAWGARQEPKLYIHKIPNRRDMKDNVARLSVELDKDVTSRPGRPAATPPAAK
jgi:hypothetical protein